MKTPEIPSWGFLFAFAGASELIPFSTNLNLRWNCPAGISELIPSGASSDCPWNLLFQEIPSRGFLLVFPCWGLLCLFVRGELHFPPLGVTIILFSWENKCNILKYDTSSDDMMEIINYWLDSFVKTFII